MTSARNRTTSASRPTTANPEERLTPGGEGQRAGLAGDWRPNTAQAEYERELVSERTALKLEHAHKLGRKSAGANT
jgi:hypothetical protein